MSWNSSFYPKVQYSFYVCMYFNKNLQFIFEITQEKNNKILHIGSYFKGKLRIKQHKLSYNSNLLYCKSTNIVTLLKSYYN